MKQGENPGDAPQKQGRCETAEELMELARKYNIKLTEEEVAELLRLMNPAAGELGEDELAAVGGGTDRGPGICPHCGVWFDWMKANGFYVCLTCGYRKGS